MKKITLLLAGILACLSLNTYADSQVTIYSPGQIQTAVISHAQNLAELVTSPALKDKTWWPGTVIADKLATAAAIAQQQQVLARLKAWSNALHASGDIGLAATVDNVWQQVAAIKVTGRLLTNLDPDWVRIRPEANRRLAGDYSMYTLQRPTTVTLAGALQGSGKTVWQPGRSVVDYLQGREHIPGAERNFAVLIAANGEVSEVPVAYWNQRHVEPGVGSIIYLGFSSWALPDDAEDLNQQIISVLTHRIPD